MIFFVLRWLSTIMGQGRPMERERIRTKGKKTKELRIQEKNFLAKEEGEYVKTVLKTNGGIYFRMIFFLVEMIRS